jgi:hypothetical protein
LHPHAGKQGDSQGTGKNEKITAGFHLVINIKIMVSRNYCFPTIKNPAFFPNAGLIDEIHLGFFT